MMERANLLEAIIAGSYWSHPTVVANLNVALSMLGALMLGMLVGFERSYRGRAAGVRTYGIVCMASCALVAIAGHVPMWFGSGQDSLVTADVSRTVQGVITGIGFLGAGVIHRDRYQTNGLTTAASLWAAAVIGVVVGVGLYLAAMLLAGLCIGCMALVASIERLLPSRSDLFVKIRFEPAVVPTVEKIEELAAMRGYELSSGSMTISFAEGKPEWSFVMSSNVSTSVSLSDLAKDLTAYRGVSSFEIAHVRN